MKTVSGVEARAMAERLMAALERATPKLGGITNSAWADDALYLEMYDALPDVISVLIAYSDMVSECEHANND